jgi:hypothetical protein
VKEHDFPVVVVLLEGQPAPGLPFLRQLHWVIAKDPASEKSLARAPHMAKNPSRFEVRRASHGRSLDAGAKLAEETQG